MELKDFVDALSFEVFDELRKVVVDRHQRDAAEFYRLLKIIQEDPSVLAALPDNPMECVKAVVDKTDAHPEMCVRAIEKYMSLPEGKTIEEKLFGGINERKT